MTQKSLLQLYAEHQGKVSDKWSSYLIEYDRLFKVYREESINLLEIGIQNGGSLEIWNEYFTNANKIIGCDINPLCSSLQYNSPEINVVVGDANTNECQTRIFEYCSDFDIIIDDGSHTSSDIIRSFLLYFPALNEGGLFVAEDLHCSYWSNYEGGLHNPYSSISFFKKLTDVINHEHWGIDKSSLELFNGFIKEYDLFRFENLLKDIHSITFINSICVIRKSNSTNNTLQSRFIAGIDDSIHQGVIKLHGTGVVAQRQIDNPWSNCDLSPSEELPLIKDELSLKDKELDLKNKEIEQLKLLLNNQELEKNTLKNDLKATTTELHGHKKRTKDVTSALEINTKKVKALKQDIQDLSNKHDQTEEILQEVLTNKNRYKQLTKTPSKISFSYIFNKSKRNAVKEQQLILSSEMFSPSHYLINNQDVWLAKANPLRHFYKFGGNEGRAPNKNFSSSNYLQFNRDVEHSGMNPLIHYIKYGKDEGRKVSALNSSPQTSLNITNNIKNSFNLHKVNNSQIDHNDFLHSYGSILPSKELNDRSLEFERYSTRLKIIEKHLISWENEYKKKRNRNLVSIIIPAFGQAQLTDNCLQSILDNDNGDINYEIIVVNNSQDQADIASLNKWRQYSKIKVIHNEENLNFALGCNIGFVRSIGSRVVFLNNDTTVTEKWLTLLVDPLTNQNISITQPRLLYPDGLLQCMGLVFSTKSNLAYPLYQGRELPDEILGSNRLFMAVTGACFAIRAKTFDYHQGFDVSFINGQEDVDLCLRINTDLNTQSMYVSNSIVYHYEGKSQGRGKFVANNRALFIERYTGKIIPDDMYHYDSDGFSVIKWQLDSIEFKKLNVENYLPKLIQEFTPTKNNLTIPEKFYIKGEATYKTTKKSILVAAHNVSKEIFGGERSFLDMVSSINNSKYNIIVIITNTDNFEYINQLKAYCCSIYIVPYRMWNKSGEDFKQVKLLEFICLANQIELVYVNTIMCREPLSAAKNLGVKSIIHVREAISKDETLSSRIPLPSSSHIIKEVHKSSDFLIMNSKFTADMFGSNNSNIVYNRIDTDSFSSLRNIVNPNKILFGIISSNIPKKGIFDFFELAKSCNNRISNAHFLLIGPDNSHTEQIKSMILACNLTNIEVKGYFSSPQEAVNECNVILSLSHFAESFGRTVGESLAGARPVIAYSQGAIPELVSHEESGLLVEFKNIEKAIEAVEVYCKEPAKINIMGERGRDNIKHISSPDIYRKKLNNLLEQYSSNQSTTKSNVSSNITIIIPVFNAYQEVQDCIDSVLNTTSHLSIELLIINDASTDLRVADILRKYSNLSNVRIINHKQNLGYTKTINEGIQASGDRDVILLNSDTIVTKNWIEGLFNTAYQDNEIGTVTAMSDNAGAFSFPLQGKENPKPPRMPYNNYAELILKQTNKLPSIIVPTGSGFCLFIKHQLIKEIGLFDDKSFPRGYGEENDFCMRAIASGWKNVISTKAFVFHIRTASFGDEKEALIQSGMNEVLKKHPEYMVEVKKAFSSNEIKKLRRIIQDQVDNLNKLSNDGN